LGMIGKDCDCEAVREQLGRVVAAAALWNSLSEGWSPWNQCADQAASLMNAINIQFPCLRFDVMGGTSEGFGLGRLGTFNHHVLIVSGDFSRGIDGNCACPDLQPILLDPFKSLTGLTGPISYNMNEFNQEYPCTCPCNCSHPSGFSTPPEYKEPPFRLPPNKLAP